MSSSRKSRRFGGRLAALSSAAILSVYAAGYVATQGAAPTADASGAAPPTDLPPSPQSTSATAKNSIVHKHEYATGHRHEYCDGRGGYFARRHLCWSRHEPPREHRGDRDGGRRED